MSKHFCCNFVTMFKTTTKLLAVFMSLTVFVSSMSFTVYQHFCGDKITDLAVFSHAKGCGMEAIVEIPENTCHTPIKPCCKDRVVSIQGQDQLNPATQALSIDYQVFLVAVFYSFDYLFSDASNNIPETFLYYPPPIVQDITILHQVFRI